MVVPGSSNYVSSMPKSIATLPWSELAEKVKKIITKSDTLNQQSFADEMGWDKSLTSRYLNGGHEPRFERRMKVIGWIEKNGK